MIKFPNKVLYFKDHNKAKRQLTKNNHNKLVLNTNISYKKYGICEDILQRIIKMIFQYIAQKFKNKNLQFF